MRRVLGLFAHPDDEIFCAGGLMARAAASGAEVKVVSFTKGEAGQIRDAALASRSTIGSVRETELADACAVLGVHDASCLDFADGTLAQIDRARLVEAAVDLIESFRPDTVVTFDHTGAYGHPDHITMSEVAVQASRRVAERADAASGAAPDRVLQACFPQSQRLLLELLVDWLASLPDRFRGTDTFVNALLMFADSSSMLGFASDHLQIEWFPKGSFVIEQNDIADSLYLLLSGGVEVQREHPDGRRERIGTVGPGEFIGETGLAYGARRNAHCIARESSACFVLTADPSSDWRPRGGVLDEPSSRTERVVESVDAGDFAVDVSDLVDRKVEALARHRSQYTIEPGLFPPAMLRALLGTEYFCEAWRREDATAPSPLLQGAHP